MMHKRLLIILVLSTLCACSSDFFDINSNPNSSTVIEPESLLPSCIYNTSQVNHQISLTTSLYAQHLASATASEIDRYGRSTQENTWPMLYNVMTDLTEMVHIARQENAWVFSGVGNVLLAYNLSLGTDLWGDLPFKNAFKGEANLYPEYDSQKEIYHNILSLLDTALVELKNERASSKSLSNDLMYNNNTQNWIKLAYALKIRFLNRLHNKMPTVDGLILNLMDSAFSSNADDAALYYTEKKINPWANVVEQLIDDGILNGYISEQFIEILTDFSLNGQSADPRLPFIVEPIIDTLVVGPKIKLDSLFIGTENGAGPPEKGFCTLTHNSWYAKNTSPVLFITFSEIKFIEAQAALRSGNKNRAFSAYLEGIIAHCKKLGLPPNIIAAFLLQVQEKISTENISSKDIFIQKWISLFLNPEAWNETRQQEYTLPQMAPPHNSLLDNSYIWRVLYPDSEYQTNSKNVPSGIELTDRLWWNK